MVGILLNTLMTACTATSHSNMDQAACEKATQAGVQQIGISQYMDSTEEHFVQFLKKKADRNVGKDGQYAVGATYFVARTAQTKSLSFGLPNLGLCDSLKTELNDTQALLRFEWRF